MNELLEGLYKDYPFLALVGPLVGIILAYIKDLGHLKGFALLFVAVATAALVILAYGVAHEWTASEWHKAPLAVIITVAFSNLTSTTALHAKDALIKKKQ